MKRIILVLMFILTITCFGKSSKVNISIRDTDIKDVFLMITKQSGINIISDNTISGNITLNLENVSPEEAIKIIEKAYKVKIEKVSENTYIASKLEKEDKLFSISYNNEKLSYSINNAPLKEVINEIANKSEVNIVLQNDSGKIISGELKNVSVETALGVIAAGNKMSLKNKNGIYYLSDKNENLADDEINIIDENGAITVKADNVLLINVIKLISEKYSKNIVIKGEITERVTIDTKASNIDNLIVGLISSNNLFFRKDGNIFFVEKIENSGDNKSYKETEIIPIKYIPIEKIPSLIPPNFPDVSIKILTEQNALLINGQRGDLEAIKKYIEKFDIKVPQLSIEALIVEISHSKTDTLKLDLGLEGDIGGAITQLADSSTGNFFYKSVGIKSKNFYAKLNMLVKDGKATIKSSPNITTLNGEKAVINVGSVQYYKVTTLTDEGKEKIDYKNIEAGIMLEVTPWLSSEEEINLKINSVISSISGAAVEGPPSVSKREAKTSVRVKDGGTIVIGGLIQNNNLESKTRVPFISKIPLIGNLFKGKQKDSNQSELIIYITPKIIKD